MKFLAQIILSILCCKVASGQYDNNGYFDDKLAIRQFFDYVDSLTDIYLGDFLEMTKNTCEEVLSEIPYEIRAEESEVLQNYIDLAKRAEFNSDILTKFEALDYLQNNVAYMVNKGYAVTQESNQINRRRLALMLIKAETIVTHYQKKLARAVNFLRKTFTDFTSDEWNYLDKNDAFFDELSVVDGSSPIQFGTLFKKLEEFRD